jgi:carboxylate-amine ligase
MRLAIGGGNIMINAPLTLGIEEEYQIIDPETRELTSYVQEMMGLGKVTLGNQLKAEFMQSQIEVGSNVCRNIKEARQEIVRLRRTVSEVAAQAGKTRTSARGRATTIWRRR